MVRKIMHPGNTTSHQALNCSRAPDSREPQVTVSTGTPTPRKDSADSVMIADDMQATSVTEMMGKALGRAWRNRIRHGLAPDALADLMKSELLIRNISALVILAISVQ